VPWAVYRAASQIPSRVALCADVAADSGFASRQPTSDGQLLTLTLSLTLTPSPLPVAALDFFSSPNPYSAPLSLQPIIVSINHPTPTDLAVHRALIISYRQYTI